MARFDVCELKSEPVQYIVKVQANILDGLQTCVIVPLLPLKKLAKEEMPRLKPLISFKGKDYIFNTTDITVVKTARIGAAVGNLEEQRHVIIDAMDFLFQGF